MNEQLAKEVVGKLVDVISQQAREHLPSYVQSNWIDALSEVLSAGLYHKLVAVLVEIQVVNIEADVVEIIDSREE